MLKSDFRNAIYSNQTDNWHLLFSGNFSPYNFEVLLQLIDSLWNSRSISWWDTVITIFLLHCKKGIYYLLQRKNIKGGIIMNSVRQALNEIRTHHKVAGYKLLGNDELEIRFTDNYKDLIIPISPKMNQDNILTVFYYYVANFWGK